MHEREDQHSCTRIAIIDMIRRNWGDNAHCTCNALPLITTTRVENTSINFSFKMTSRITNKTYRGFYFINKCHYEIKLNWFTNLPKFATYDI